MPQNHIWCFSIGGDNPITVAAMLPYVDSTRIVELEYDMDVYLRNHVGREAVRQDPIFYVRQFFRRNGLEPQVLFPLQYEI